MQNILSLIKFKKIDTVLFDISNEIYGEKKKINKKIKKINWIYNKRKQFFLILKNNKKTVGIMRVIKKKMFYNSKYIKVACLTDIGIRKIFRKRGYAKILLNKSLNLLSTEFDAALLIARKKLDFFYGKFGFLGNTEFVEMKINLKNKNIKKNKIMLKKSNFNEVNKKLYNQTFSKKNGFLFRDKYDWDFLKIKIKHKKLKFLSIYNNYKKEIGYIVYKKNEILEYAFDKKYIEVFYKAIQQKFRGVLIIKNPTKYMVDNFQLYNEISILKRFCLYGGHMVKFFNNYSSKIKYNVNFLDEF